MVFVITPHNIEKIKYWIYDVMSEALSHNNLIFNSNVKKPKIRITQLD